MNAPSRRLPPLNALRAFEASARHLSFKRAGAELNVTPAAISQQVKALEDFCGQPLFRRMTRAIALTDAGRAALPLLTEGFDRLDEAAERMRFDVEDELLTVSVPPSFGAKWLIPRLSHFRAAHPDLDVRIDATDMLADFAPGGAHLAIRYGRGDYPGLEVTCLLEETVFPVCSPKLLEGGPPLTEPPDLARHTLLHIEWTKLRDTSPSWEMWLRAAGVDGVDASRGLRFSAEVLAVEAAIAGQGVALTTSALVGDDLGSGRLVRPFAPPAGGERTAFCYYLVYPERHRRNRKLQAFRDWAIAEAALSPEI